MSDQFGENFSGIEIITPNWPASSNVRAFTTTRNGGFSRGQWSSLNLGDHCGDNPAHVEQNRQMLQALLPSKPRWLRQVHGNRVLSWGEYEDVRLSADAIFSNQAGQVCAVLTADCLPVLFCNKEGTMVAAAHAGWRGLSQGVLESTISAMNCSPDMLMAWLGPAIGPEAYVVGQDVYESFVSVNSESSKSFKRYRDRYLVNLYQLARLMLNEAGVIHVSGGQHCTHSEQDRFFSYRRDGQTGRMATVIWS